MTHDPLEQLLRDADEGEATDSTRSDLAQRVRDVAARRARRARLAAGGVVAGCIAALAVWFARPATELHPTQPIVRVTKPAPTNENARTELLTLAQEADRRAAAAEAMWSVELRARRTASVAASPDVADYVERATFTMVYQAARMPAAGGATSPAAAVYRQVSQAFPDAPSAQVARQRLSELTNRKDG